MSLPYSLWIFNNWLQFLANQLFALSNHLISTDFRWFLALCKKVTKVTHTNPQKWLAYERFESLYDFYTAFPNEETCIAYLEKVLWPNGVVSPYDVSSKVYKRGDGYYRCKNTGKNFNVRIGTIFENTKIPLRKWSLAMYFVANHRKGISATQLSSDIGVTLKTAWFHQAKVI